MKLLILSLLLCSKLSGALSVAAIEDGRLRLLPVPVGFSVAVEPLSSGYRRKRPEA